MLSGVALVPAAPVLLDALAPSVPDEVATLRRAAEDAVAALPAAPLALLLAAGERPALWAGVDADLAGLGRPDLAVARSAAAPARALAASLGLPVAADRLPLDLALLAWRTAPATPVVGVTVPAQAPAAALVDLGERLVGALDGRDAVIIAAADGSAGLSTKAPRHLVDGAEAWQAAYRAALAGPDLPGLAALGPAEAARVASRGWASALAATAAATAAGLETAVAAAGAPRGVGYVVAIGRGAPAGAGARRATAPEGA
ncbi:MAG: hypothetical protein ACQETV_01335 [Actinomycetota bacterium]